MTSGWSRLLWTLPMVLASVALLLAFRHRLWARLSERGSIVVRGAEAPITLAGYPSALEHTTTLLDGRQVLIRPIRPTDLGELRRAIEHADPETLRTRFLGAGPPRRELALQRLVCVDYDRRLAVVAVTTDEQGVGIARYEALGDSDTAEVAVTVDPEWRHIGLATALLDVLAAGAVRSGIRQFTAEFFSDNLDVADLLAEAGLPFRSSRDATGVVTAEMFLPEQEQPGAPERSG